jgi:formylglycine-generating enzyme required for sulfatase activity/serine/threonine protein kinase
MDAAPSLHPTDQTLSSYGLGKLDDRSAESVNKHLEGCPDCRKRVAEMSSDSFLDRVRDAQKPSGKSTSGQSQAGGTLSYKGSNAPVPPPADTLPPGLADHPDYEIKRELGRGGMGVVYLAHNTLMGRDEVLKVMGHQIMERPGVLDRFLREIRAVAKLRHPNIVTAYSATRLGESIVFAMEYVEGLDLSKMVKAKGPLPVGHACYFVHQAALGLQHAHEAGLVHRDIKPGNLMLSRKGEKPVVKVLDFGLAKATRDDTVDNGLTSQGQALGTPDFIAPEQILDAPSADVRADIYSLGGTLYYLLTGRPPFRANSLYDVYQAHISRDADPLNLVRPEVPAELAALVAKMMAKDPARRFQTPGEVAEALAPFYKKGGAAIPGANPEVSQGGRPNEKPTQPPAIVTPAAGDTKPARPDSAPEGLIDPREEHPLSDTIPDRSPPAVEKPSGPGRRGSPAVAVALGPPGPGRRWATAGLLLLGLVVAGALILRVRTAGGVIVLENLPENAVVEVDGDRVTVIPKEGEPVGIEAAAGKHGVVVKRGNDLLLGESVTVESGKQHRLTVRLESPAANGPREALPPAADGPAAGGRDVTERREPIESPAKVPGELPQGDDNAPTRTAKSDTRPDAHPAAAPSPAGKPIKNSIGMRLNFIPAGEFMMGSPDSDVEAEDNEKPQHRVRITRPFYLGTTEVTQGQYRAVTGVNPSHLKGSDDLPVENVWWNDAIVFCNKLSVKEGLKPYYKSGTSGVPLGGDGYRLPTEAEWEYACRAGSTTSYSFGDDAASLDEYAWFDGNSGEKTHPVGQKRPNAWGLFDMHGNVWEWCWDWYDEKYYGQMPGADPFGPSQANLRVDRVGSWLHNPRYCRSASRFWYTPGRRNDYLGFRVARVQSGR